MNDRQAARAVEVVADDVEDLEALYAELSGAAGIIVDAAYASLQPGDQGGALDFLTVACSGGAITVLLQIIKTLVESRSPRFVLKISRGRDSVQISAANVDEALDAIRELVGGS